MKKLTFLISTYGERVTMVPSIFLNESDFISYVVVAQSVPMESKGIYTEKVNSRVDVNSVFVDGKGLTKSRNIALSNIPADTDIIYFLDDDVLLEVDCYSTIVEAFSTTDNDVTTFPVSTPDGGTLLKKYSERAFEHNLLTIMRVGSIEIAAKTSVFKGRGQVAFPEYLGVGTEYPQCEEPVFLSRLLKAGCKIGYMPVVTVRHPLESSGKTMDNKYVMMARGIAFKEVYGIFCYPLSFAFFLKSFRKIGYNRLLAFIHLYKGIFVSTQVAR